jgi:hypothetical protein
MKRRVFLFHTLLFGILTAALAFAAPAMNPSRYGKRLTLGKGANAITVLYLRGTPYEMGYAHGKLCAKEVRYLAETVAPRMMKQADLSPEKVDSIWSLYERHLRPAYLEELRGLSDGSGVPLADLRRLHALPDISEWHCTFFAARGPATRNGDLVQIRALDYETEAGIQRYPALFVYDPDQGIPFVNVGWLGQCGVVTGMNARGIAMSEIGDDWDKTTDNFDGRPLNYVMRDALQFGSDLAAAIREVKSKPRTTSLLYCLSSAKDRQVRALKTSHVQCVVYDPGDLPFPTHPGMVYFSMGMDSPWNRKVGSFLNRAYGRLDVKTAEALMHRLKTGSLHAVVFRPGKLDLWVANATDTTMAYDRPFLYFSLKSALRDPFFRAAPAKLKSPSADR